MTEPPFPPVPQLPPLERDWRAEIKRTRWFWTISVAWSDMVSGVDYFAWSKAHAVRKARRILARRMRAEQRERDAVRFTVRSGDSR